MLIQYFHPKTLGDVLDYFLYHKRSMTVYIYCTASELVWDSYNHCSTKEFATTVRASIELMKKHSGERMLGSSSIFFDSADVANIVIANVDRTQPLGLFHMYSGMGLLVEEFTFADDTAFAGSWLK